MNAIPEQVSEVSHRAVDFVRDHPVASLGATLASGLVLGVVAHKLLEHRPTVREVLVDRLGLERLGDRIRQLG